MTTSCVLLLTCLLLISVPLRKASDAGEEGKLSASEDFSSKKDAAFAHISIDDPSKSKDDEGESSTVHVSIPDLSKPKDDKNESSTAHISINDPSNKPKIDEGEFSGTHVSITDPSKPIRDDEGESSITHVSIDDPSKLKNDEGESSQMQVSIDDSTKPKNDEGESSEAHVLIDERNPSQPKNDEGESSQAHILIDDPGKVGADEGESSSSKKISIMDEDAVDIIEMRRMLDSEEEQMIIWKVQNSEAIQAEIPNYNEFSTSEAYIMIQGRPNVKCERWLVFYWIGKESSNVDAGDAASFTVLLDAIVHSRINIHREPEGRESDAFKEAFRRVQDMVKDEIVDTSMPSVSNESMVKDEAVDTPTSSVGVGGEAKDKAVDTTMPNVQVEGTTKNEAAGISTPNAEVEGTAKDEVASTSIPPLEQVLVEVPKMFLIKEIEKDVRFGKVELSSHYIDEKDVCLVLISDKVYVYCGNAALDAPKTTAEDLAKMVSQKRTPETEIVTILRNDQNWSDLKDDEQKILWNFSNEIDRCARAVRLQFGQQPGVMPAQIGEPWKNLPMIRVYEENDAVQIEEIVEDSEKPVSSLKTTDCYVISVDENAGVLVWMGTKSEIDEREECARKAELHLREKNYDHATTITFVDEEVMKLPPKANIGDYIKFLSGLGGPLVLPERENLTAPVSLGS